MRLETGLTRRRRARVEMIPLIDCMFILLVFFIYSMLNMTIQRGLPVNLPSGERVERLDAESAVITVSRDGAIFLDREPVTLGSLAERVGAKVGGESSPRLVVNADAAAAHGVVFSVLDALRGRGWTNVAILSTEHVEP
ncbi:MAG: biopolymer transporter ExbD [Phycisphaerales bacterium]|nr:biopolymer transporter ExbD [Phycisphaerales bacterium]